MKKIFLFIMLLIMPTFVNAANNIHNIDIDVYLDQDGSAYIREVWDVDGEDGSEWYRIIKDFGNMGLSDFTVSMDGRMLNYKDWNVDENLEQKRGYYGINYTNTGLELCFGKYDYNRHMFILNYKLSNFVFNTEDSQVIYFNFVDKLSNVDFNNFSVDITSYYSFPKKLDVWGYGYRGYAYVKDGKISMSNEDNFYMNNNYAVLLVKFPSGTFNTLNSYSQFKAFDDVYIMAEKDSFDYYYDNKIEIIITIVVSIVLAIITIFLPSYLLYRAIFIRKYRYIDNKKIDIKNIPMFREIPCNKDIYYANSLLKLNNIDRSYKASNILGAIILKWVRNDKVLFRNEKEGIFNQKTSVIDLTREVSFDNDLEKKLFIIMKNASNDGLLKPRELNRWCKKNYEKFIDLFNDIVNYNLDILKANGYICEITDSDGHKFKNVMSDEMYNDSVKLYGLKKYLKEFSKMDTKEVMDVKIWDEYLMFAYLFGIADKVAKQLKNMYPELKEEMQSQNMGYETIDFVNYISITSFNAVNRARQSTGGSGGSDRTGGYSSGGGGRSSGGGGRGSFGGGGGGSR